MSTYADQIAEGLMLCTTCGERSYNAGAQHERWIYREEGQGEDAGPEGGDVRYSHHSVFGKYVCAWVVPCGPVVHHSIIADGAA